MAIKLSTSTRSTIDNWYETYVQKLTGYSLSKLQQDNPGRFKPDYPISSYLKIEGINSKILSAEDLFQLTKILPVSQVRELRLNIVSGTKQVFDERSRQMIDVPNIVSLSTPIPAGADDGVKKAIFNAKILPGITKHYASILDRGAIDDITKSVLRKWWNGNQNNLFDRYMEIAESFSGIEDLATAQSGLRGYQIPSLSTGVVARSFFVSIYTGDANIQSQTLEALGFSDFIAENMPFFKKAITNRSLQGLEDAKARGDKGYANIVASALEVDGDLSAEDLSNLDQCALITGLIHDDKDYNFRRYISSDDPLYDSPLKKNANGSNRIFPVTIDPGYNPNKLINNCVINKKVKNVFNTTDTKTPHNMVKSIFWVYESGEGEFRSLREAELTTNSTAYRKKISNVYEDLKRNAANPYTGTILDHDLQKMARFEDSDKKRDSSYYFLENTKINFDGTDPSSARNDVKVEMTWKLGSLEGLNSTMATLGEEDGQASGTEIVIMDLITLPNTGKPNSSNGPSQFLTNQYSPNYSRLRLKVAPYGDKGGDHQEDCMILDLAIIDHTISRSSETGETTLTINYRGYFEATLNMPYNDALATPKILDERQARQKQALDGLSENNCSVEIVREALRLEQRTSKSESDNLSAGTILKRMQDRNMVHFYKLNELKMASGTFGNLLDGRQMYVEDVVPQAGTSDGAITNEDVENLVGALKDSTEKEKEEKYNESYKKLRNRFFFLGDLMHVLLDCLYKEDSVAHRDSLKNLNLRFVMGTIFAPNPKDLGGSPIIINPISIPIDMRFFVQWFNATVVNKGMTHYPIGAFIRDLVERLVNNVIYDTCFSLLMPDENPPVLKSRTFISNNSDQFVKDSSGWFDPKNPSGNGDVDILFSKGFTSKNASRGESWSQEISSKNYCVIYQQFPSYKRQLAAEDNGYLRDDEYTPTIYYGSKNKNYNFLSDVSFSKTNSPFLREARFASSNYGGLALLSNVYDLSFSFKRRKANTMFYPGCIINFVLLDWGKRWVDDTPWHDDGAADITHYFGTGILGDSDPHRDGTVSNIMGMGGYFIILSVEYNLGQTPGEFEINITTKFLGTDASKKLIRTSPSLKELREKAKCENIFNNLADRVNETIRENETGEDPVAHIGDGGRTLRDAEEANAGSARESEVSLDETTNADQTSEQYGFDSEDPLESETDEFDEFLSAGISSDSSLDPVTPAPDVLAPQTSTPVQPY